MFSILVTTVKIGVMKRKQDREIAYVGYPTNIR